MEVFEDVAAPIAFLLHVIDGSKAVVNGKCDIWAFNIDTQAAPPAEYWRGCLSHHTSGS